MTFFMTDRPTKILISDIYPLLNINIHIHVINRIRMQGRRTNVPQAGGAAALKALVFPFEGEVRSETGSRALKGLKEQNVLDLELYNDVVKVFCQDVHTYVGDLQSLRARISIRLICVLPLSSSLQSLGVLYHASLSFFLVISILRIT